MVMWKMTEVEFFDRQQGSMMTKSISNTISTHTSTFGKSHKKNSMLAGAVLAAAGMAFSSTASAVTYYNCTSTSGCTKVSKWSWGKNTVYAKTKHPVVLQHGMMGSNPTANPNFYGIQEDLAKNGAAVYLTETNAFHSSMVRGETLLKQLETIQATTDTQKFNLVGHSHGGFDIRYVAGVRPDMVASVTAVGSPARGSEIAEMVTGITTAIAPMLDGKILQAVASIVNWVGSLQDNAHVKDNLQQDSLAGLKSLTFKGAAEFNARFPTAIESTCDSHTNQADYENGVVYYSWSGTSQLTNPFDPVDYGMSLLNVFFKGQPNDGLVSRCSSHVGYVIRDNYKMNHLDEINQNFGLVNWFEANPKTVHRTQINRLKNKGL